MNKKEILNLKILLKDLGLANMPGSFNYSSFENSNKSPIYFLGSSPGGNPIKEKQTIIEHFNFMIKNPRFNEYYDGIWSPRGRPNPIGQSPLQKRVQYLLESLMINPRAAFSTNLIFARFHSESNIQNYNQLANKCWPVHSFLIEKINPNLIIVLGNKCFEFVCNQMTDLSNIKQFKIDHGQGWTCKQSSGLLKEKRRDLIMLPHLSRFAINQIKHKPIIEWIKCFLGNGRDYKPVMG